MKNLQTSIIHENITLAPVITVSKEDLEKCNTTTTTTIHNNNTNKCNKGRLKKLKNKASYKLACCNNSHNNQVMTGITSYNEAAEYRELVNNSSSLVKDRQQTQTIMEKGDKNRLIALNHDDESCLQESNHTLLQNRTSTLNATIDDNHNNNYNMKELTMGPSIILSKNINCIKKEEFDDTNLYSHCDAKNWRVTEGVHHRDIIHTLLFKSNTDQNNTTSSTTTPTTKTKKSKSNKKRKLTHHNTSTTSTNAADDSYHNSLSQIPSWIKIHNPALMQTLLIIEFHIVTKRFNHHHHHQQHDPPQKSFIQHGRHNDNDTSFHIMPSSRIHNSLHSNNNNHSNNNSNHNILTYLASQHGYKGRKALPFHVQLFQGNQTRHLSDVLMYYPNNGNNNNNNSRTLEPSSTIKNTTDTPLPSGNNESNRDCCDNQNTIDYSNKPSTSITTQNYSSKECCQTVLLSLVEPLIIPPHILKREGYPCVRNIISTSNNTTDNVQQKQQQESPPSLQMLEGNTTCLMILELLQRISNHVPYITELRNETSNSLSLPFTNVEATEIIKFLTVEVVGDDCNDSTYNKNNHQSVSSPTSAEVNFDIESKYISSCLSLKHNTHTSYKREPNIYALDCEMVRTKYGMELARITLIRLDTTHTQSTSTSTNDDDEGDEKYTVLIDAFVKPASPILDYLTQYSGITPSKLQNVCTTLQDIQCCLASLIYKEDILIGHSLENDLKALRFVHEKVVDTALLFRRQSSSTSLSRSGGKHSLKYLSSCLLKRKIQVITNNNSGHCSEEDAVAALLLVVRRAKNPSLQVPDKQRDRVNLWNLITQVRKNDKSSNLRAVSNSNCFLMQNYNKPMVCIGPSDWINQHIGPHSCAHALSCDDIKHSNTKAIVSYLREGPRMASLIWAKLCVNGTTYNESNQDIDELLTKIIEVAQPSTQMLFLFQRGYDDAKAISKQRVACNDVRSTLGWTDEQEDDWAKSVEKARSCEALWIGSL